MIWVKITMNKTGSRSDLQVKKKQTDKTGSKVIQLQTALYFPIFDDKNGLKIIIFWLFLRHYFIIIPYIIWKNLTIFR